MCSLPVDLELEGGGRLLLRREKAFGTVTNVVAMDEDDKVLPALAG